MLLLWVQLSLFFGLLENTIGSVHLVINFIFQLFIVSQLIFFYNSMVNIVL